MTDDLDKKLEENNFILANRYDDVSTLIPYKFRSGSGTTL